MWSGIIAVLVIATNLLSGAQQSGLGSLTECLSWVDRAQANLPDGYMWIGGSCYSSDEQSAPAPSPINPETSA